MNEKWKKFLMEIYDALLKEDQTGKKEENQFHETS